MQKKALKTQSLGHMSLFSNYFDKETHQTPQTQQQNNKLNFHEPNKALNFHKKPSKTISKSYSLNTQQGGQYDVLQHRVKYNAQSRLKRMTQQPPTVDTKDPFLMGSISERISTRKIPRMQPVLRKDKPSVINNAK